MTDVPPNPLAKPGYVLAWHDEFDGGTVDTTKWIPHYLPQWSSREQARATSVFRDDMLVLQIVADQQPWCPEFDGGNRASGLQTGLYAGPVGSPLGQSRFDTGLVVREEQTNARLFLMHYGYVEYRARCCGVAGDHVSLWMIGYEQEPHESGEIAVFEVFGKDVGTAESTVCYGIHPWSDPTLTDEFFCEPLPMDATEFHIFACEWTPEYVEFFVDGRRLRRVAQSPNYPLQLMLAIFERPGGDTDAPYPREFVVDYVRVYERE